MARVRSESIARISRGAFSALLALGLSFAASAQAQFRPEAAEPVEGWLLIGDFTGSADVGLRSRVSNWFFEYERGDNLYRDMGDLGIGIGGDIGEVRANLDWYFRRRVARSQEVKPRGSTITAGDISYLSNINTSRIRLRADWNYLQNEDEWAGVGVRTEGGFSVTMARKRQPKVHLPDTVPTEALEGGWAEFKEFFVEEDVNLKENNIVYVTVGSMAAVVDGAAGAVGNRFASTEHAAVYWDEYSRPMMLFPRTGIPVKLSVFTGDDPTLAVGDSLTFLTFVGLSPLTASVNNYGIRLGYQRYLRLLRETTVVKEPDDEVLVRVRDWRGNGNEVTPFKYRPEVRLWILKLGYTFFESVVDRYRERVSDITYRIDLKTEEGMELFKHLVKKSARVRVTPEVPGYDSEADEPAPQSTGPDQEEIEPDAVVSGSEAKDAEIDLTSPDFDPEAMDGVEVLYSELDRGKTHNGRVRANFFSWFTYHLRQLGNTRRIVTRDAEFREITRGRMKEYRNFITAKRRAKLRSVIRVQSDIDWFDPEATPGFQEDERLATSVTTNVSLGYASQAEIRTLVRSVVAILALQDPDPALAELLLRQVDERTEFSLDLVVSFGPSEIKRLEMASVDDTWKALAEMLLGPEHGEAWATATARHWWEPGAPAYTGPQGSWRHIGLYYDNVRGYTKPPGDNRFFDPQHRRSQKLYRMAKKAVRKFGLLQEAFSEKSDCLQCLIDGYSSELDFYLMQALAVRFGGGVDGGVGFEYRFLLGDMTKPVGGSNDVLHGFHLDSAEIVPNTETIRDSPPRLRNGQALLNVGGAESEATNPDASCWKIRLFSDYLFADDLTLRVQGSKARKLKKNVPLVTMLLPMGDPQPIDELPEIELARELFDARTQQSLTSEYAVGRNYLETLGGSASWAAEMDLPDYFYEIDIPNVAGAELGKDYTALLRVVNGVGLPVTEEQEIRLRLPDQWIDMVPEHCEIMAPQVPASPD